jgi:hypothetical protein
MKRKKKSLLGLILAAALALSLAACGSTGTQGAGGAGEGADDTASPSGGAAAQTYENGGFKLSVPAEYDALVIVDTAREDALFSVSEKASAEAAKALGEDYDGAGWLFSIGRVGEAELHEMLCYDMSGAEAFAKGDDGQYYIFYHPTDVRIVRESYEDMEEDMKEWTALNEWGAAAPAAFIAENPGLTPEKRGNTALDMYLARIAYMGGVNYAIEDKGSADVLGADAPEYAERLINGVTFEPADDAEAPDGEYISLTFPDDGTRFDFFLAEGKENYVRQVWSDGYEQLYKATFADGASKASEIVCEWHDALVDGTAGASGFTGEEFVGEWQDSVSQRAVMSVTPADETGAYNILIHWGGSYNSAVQWRMKAVAGAQDEILSYEGGVKAEVTFPDDGGPAQETVLWDDGSGYFMFRDGVLTWSDERETEAENCRFVKAE